MAVLTDEPVFVSDNPEPLGPRSASTLDVSLRWLLAGCSVGAAVIHFGFAPTHFSEYWLYGLFFMVIAWLQLLWAGAIVVRPSRWLLVAGALGNEAVVAVWIASRTIGVWVGPNASAARSMGWEPQFTLREGVEAVVQFIRERGPEAMHHSMGYRI